MAQSVETLKTVSWSSTAKRSAIGVVSCHGFSEMTLLTDASCQSRCGTLKSPQCSMAMSAEHRSFAALSLVIVTSPSEFRVLEWDENPQTNPQTNKQTKYNVSMAMRTLCTNRLEKHAYQSTGELKQRGRNIRWFFMRHGLSEELHLHYLHNL